MSTQTIETKPIQNVSGMQKDINPKNILPQEGVLDGKSGGTVNPQETSLLASTMLWTNRSPKSVGITERKSLITQSGDQFKEEKPVPANKVLMTHNGPTIQNTYCSPSGHPQSWDDTQSDTGRD